MKILTRYKEIVTLLEDNKGSVVSDILNEVYALCKSKQSSHCTVRYNDKNELTHIFCNYHKEWEELKSVPYGKKSGTKSGLNTACKEGNRLWTNRNNEIKRYEEDLRKLHFNDLLINKITKDHYANKILDIPSIIEKLKLANSGVEVS